MRIRSSIAFDLPTVILGVLVVVVLDAFPVSKEEQLIRDVPQRLERIQSRLFSYCPRSLAYSASAVSIVLLALPLIFRNLVRVGYGTVPLDQIWQVAVLHLIPDLAMTSLRIVDCGRLMERKWGCWNGVIFP